MTAVFLSQKFLKVDCIENGALVNVMSEALNFTPAVCFSVPFGKAITHGHHNNKAKSAQSNSKSNCLLALILNQGLLACTPLSVWSLTGFSGTVHENRGPC